MTVGWDGGAGLVRVRGPGRSGPRSRTVPHGPRSSLVHGSAQDGSPRSIFGCPPLDRIKARHETGTGSATVRSGPIHGHGSVRDGLERPVHFNTLLREEQKQTGYGKSVIDETSTSSSSRGNYASKSDFAHSATSTCDILVLASIPTTRSSDWIVDSGASRHVTGAVGEFSSYSRLAVSKSIHTSNGMTQPVVDKDTVKCPNTLILSNVLHAPSFPVNLLSISVIVS
jgi:hypothetical protein